MQRRSFIQSAGGVAALSVLHGSASALSSGTPGRILAIAAHPGDGMFTMGAILAQQIERGGSGVLLSLSLGEKGAPKNIPTQQYGEMQRTATEKAVHLIGGEAVFLNYADAEIPFNEESSLQVCDLIREKRPEIVGTHWSGSRHKDHQNCHVAVAPTTGTAHRQSTYRPASPSQNRHNRGSPILASPRFHAFSAPAQRLYKMVRPLDYSDTSRTTTAPIALARVRDWVEVK